MVVANQSCACPHPRDGAAFGRGCALGAVAARGRRPDRDCFDCSGPVRAGRTALRRGFRGMVGGPDCSEVAFVQPAKTAASYLGFHADPHRACFNGLLFHELHTVFSSQ